jgi:hypothetical protein
MVRRAARFFGQAVAPCDKSPRISGRLSHHAPACPTFGAECCRDHQGFKNLDGLSYFGNGGLATPSIAQNMPPFMIIKIFIANLAHQ